MEAKAEWKSHKINLLLKITRHFRNSISRRAEGDEDDEIAQSASINSTMEEKEISSFTFFFVFLTYILLLHDVFDKDDDIKLSEWVWCCWIRQRINVVRKKAQAGDEDDGNFFIRFRRKIAFFQYFIFSLPSPNPSTMLLHAVLRRRRYLRMVKMLLWRSESHEKYEWADIKKKRRRLQANRDSQNEEERREKKVETRT